MPSFNLVEEPWLPCLFPDGTRRELGLEETLRRAHEIGEVFDPSPLVTVALHRLLLAVLHRALRGPTSFHAWTDFWRRGQWDDERIAAYLNAWRHRFDLFDPERPFYQVPTLLTAKQHPVALLAQEIASANNATLFDHGFSDADQLMPAPLAARYLVARQAFSLGGGKSQPFNLTHSTLASGYSVLAMGEALFQTLALNLVAYSSERPIPHIGDDQPAWERDPPPPPERGARPRGYVDFLTWQSRRIHLITEGDLPVVRSCQLVQNRGVVEDVRDPFKSYTVSKQHGWVPRHLRLDRALWRDSHAVLQESTPASRRPELFEWLATIEAARRAGDIDARKVYQYGVFGIAADKASVHLWRHERLPLPLAYLDDEELRDVLQIALDLSEQVGALFRTGFADDPEDGSRRLPRPLQVLAEGLLPAPGDGSADRGSVQKLIAHFDPERRYWSRLDEPFRQLLDRLPTDRTTSSDGDSAYGGQATTAWAIALEGVARDVFGELIRGMDSSARELEAVARAERMFALWIRKLLGWSRERTEEGEATDASIA